MFAYNLTTKTAHNVQIDRKAIITKAVNRKNAESVISAIRAIGIKNKCQTDNAWKEFYRLGDDGKLHFSTELFKAFLFHHDYITEEQYRDEKLSMRIILPCALKAFVDGVMPIKLTKQTGIIGYSPIRLSTSFTGKMLHMWAFSTVSLVNKFCLARMKNPDLVCYNCYVEKSLHLEGALNYVQNFFFLTYSILPDILIPEINPINVKLHPFIRLESFGDIENETQFRNYRSIAINNPLFNFTEWTKNIAIAAKVIRNEGKLSNMKLEHSMSKVNKMDKNYLEYRDIIDGYFLVVNNDNDRKRYLGYHHAKTCKCFSDSCYSICQSCYKDNFAIHVERLRIQ